MVILREGVVEFGNWGGIVYFIHWVSSVCDHCSFDITMTVGGYIHIPVIRLFNEERRTVNMVIVATIAEDNCVLCDSNINSSCHFLFLVFDKIDIVVC
jgi:hypothetical protein